MLDLFISGYILIVLLVVAFTQTDTLGTTSAPSQQAKIMRSAHGNELSQFSSLNCLHQNHEERTRLSQQNKNSITLSGTLVKFHHLTENIPLILTSTNTAQYEHNLTTSLTHSTTLNDSVCNRSASRHEGGTSGRSRVLRPIELEEIRSGIGIGSVAMSAVIKIR